MPDLSEINRFLQDTLARKGRSSVAAVEAAKWLDRANLLRDSATRPGFPLRRLLRREVIVGQRRESNGRWFIDGMGADRMESDGTRTKPDSLGDGSSTSRHEGRGSQAHDVLADILTPGLRVVFVGTAVGDTSARGRHYYSDPSNAFYRELYAAALTPRVLLPSEDATLPTYGIGLTDIVKDRHTGDDAALDAASLQGGCMQLRQKLQHFRPGMGLLQWQDGLRGLQWSFGNLWRGECDHRRLSGVCRAVHVWPSGRSPALRGEDANRVVLRASPPNRCHLTSVRGYHCDSIYRAAPAWASPVR